jgi:hypothetical protein
MGHQPDLVWIKRYTGSIASHELYDSVRGTQKALYSNLANSEGTYTGTIGLLGFESTGFQVGTGGGVNAGPNAYVAWTWKAGGNKNTFNIDDVGYASASAAGLDGGTITPTAASVNTKSGFSIIGYAGGDSNGTISHGLGKKPSFMIFKDRDNGSTSWLIYHTSLGATKYLDFTTAIANTSSNPFANTEPTSTVFTAGNWLDNTTNYISYLWTEIPGFSKFGSYEGVGGTAVAPFIFTGFRPKLVLIKRTTVSTGNWAINDGERNAYNPAKSALFPDNSSSEDATRDVDLLSNGFAVTNTTPIYNSDGSIYIYAAFAEAPSFNLYGAQSNAR